MYNSCIYVCIYVYTPKHLHAYTYIYAHTCIHTYVNMHTDATFHSTLQTHSRSTQHHAAPRCTPRTNTDIQSPALLGAAAPAPSH